MLSQQRLIESSSSFLLSRAMTDSMDSSVPDLAASGPEKAAATAVAVDADAVAAPIDSKAETSSAAQDVPVERSKPEPAETAAAIPAKKPLSDQPIAQSVSDAPDTTWAKPAQAEDEADPAADKDAGINAVATKVQEEPEVEPQHGDDKKENGRNEFAAATGSQSLPDENIIGHEEYLRNEVADVIRSGLKELAKTRPPDPVGWLGNYLCTQARLQTS